MKKVLFAMALMVSFSQGFAQETETQPLFLTLEDALKIALSENVSVKVADKEIQRSEYALKGTYASLFPQVDASVSYQRTIKKQVMYMDFDMSSITGAFSGGDSDMSQNTEGSVLPSGGGIEVGRWNTYSGGITAALPLVNAQLWKSIAISGQDVELAVEKARSSRLDMVTQVKQAFFAVLLAKQAYEVYEEVFDNASENFRQTEMRYNVQKASELDYTRAKANVSSAIPNLYQAESSIELALWQLKAVIGMDLETEMDVVGSLDDYSQQMFRDLHENDDVSLDGNSTMRQLSIQAEQLANNIKIQRYATLPSLAMSFTYSMNAMTNDFNFSEYKWSPYSFVGLSLQIPIFAGGKRYNNIRQAQVQYDEFKMQAENTERQLRIAIQQYLTQMETNMKSYDSAQSTVELARKAYDIAAKSYNVGRSTLTDLNDAQLALTQAELGVSQAVYNFVIAKSNLEQVIGADFISE